MQKAAKQKKILALLVTVILVISLFTLTGCGNQQNLAQTTGGNLPNNQMQNGQVADNQQGQAQSQGNTASPTGLQISSVVEDFDGQHDEAIVRLQGDNNYYVINQEGKVLYSFLEQDKVPYISKDMFKYYNGYLLINYEPSSYSEDSKRVNYVKDLRDNSIKVEGTDLIELVDITESGYILEKVTIENLAGEKYESRIVDMQGNVIWKNEDSKSIEYFQTVIGDYVAYRADRAGGNYYIIDAKTGKSIDTGFSCIPGYFECIPFGDYLLTGISANNDKYIVIDLKNFKKINTNLSHVHKILNDKYVYATPLWGTVGIYTMEGKLAKDLTEGEVEDIFYSNNTYHVISKTGYYYTLNDSFEYVKEPKKMLEDTYTAIDIGPNVTEFSMDLTYYYIPTNQFAPDQDLSTVATQGNLSTVNGKVATVIQSGMTKLINLETLQEIPIQK